MGEAAGGLDPLAPAGFALAVFAWATFPSVALRGLTPASPPWAPESATLCVFEAALTDISIAPSKLSTSFFMTDTPTPPPCCSRRRRLAGTRSTR